jgi:ATP-dependent DNA helicase RecG
MNKNELLELIKTMEGYTLEFKKSLNSSISKVICAFANASGGKIILGVKDNSKIVGYKSTNKDSSTIQNIARNPILMDMMFRADYVEKIGSGIKRIIRDMKNYNLKIDFKITSDWFRVVFHRKHTVLEQPKIKNQEKISGKIRQLIVENNMKDLTTFIENKLGENWQKVGSKLSKSWEKTNKKLGKNQIKIIALIIIDKKITTKKISEILNISTTAVENNIKKLKEKNIIKRKGPAKGGHWEINEK